jgi:hypothetical protein
MRKYSRNTVDITLFISLLICGCFTKIISQWYIAPHMAPGK